MFLSVLLYYSCGCIAMIDHEQWRVCIGMWQFHMYKVRKRLLSHHLCIPLGVYTLLGILTLTVSILLSGDIELNPGPGKIISISCIKYLFITSYSFNIFVHNSFCGHSSKSQ